MRGTEAVTETQDEARVPEGRGNAFELARVPEGKGDSFEFRERKSHKKIRDKPEEIKVSISYKNRQISKFSKRGEEI